MKRRKRVVERPRLLAEREVAGAVDHVEMRGRLALGDDAIP